MCLHYEYIAFIKTGTTRCEISLFPHTCRTDYIRGEIVLYFTQTSHTQTRVYYLETDVERDTTGIKLCCMSKYC
jgi:hypothetical protein